MNTELIQDMKVLSTQTYHNTEVGFLQAVGMMQDNMCEYFKNIGCDGPTLVPSHNSFFVLTKTKLKLHSKPRWLQKITLKTDLCKLTGIRVNLAHNICDVDDNLMIEGVQELCPIDVTTRRVKRLNEIPFPMDASVNTEYENSLVFEKFDEELTKENLVEKAKVTTNNIDYYSHTNNIEYVKFMLSALPSAEFYKVDVNTFEIHYINESREGDELDIYLKRNADNFYFEIKNKDICVCKARMTF